MSRKQRNPQALQKLVEILELAVDAQADCVTLEYASGGGLEFMIVKGNLGSGGFIADRDLAQDIMTCVERRMVVTLRGETRGVSARRYDNFGECAFELRVVRRSTRTKKP